MAYFLKIIKPSRIQAKSPTIKKLKIIENAKKGIETSLIFDLNVLSKMNEVEQGKISFQHSGLKNLVNLLNSTKVFFIVPGFALQEVDSTFLKTITNSYNSFLLKYCPGYIDDPRCTRNYDENESGAREFQKLSIPAKYLNSVAYLGILKIQLICKTMTGLTPIQKFESYMKYMVYKADMVGAVEAEAAKYVFFDSNEIVDIKFQLFCKKIKENFRKSGGSGQKVLVKCLNSARDIVYYRLVASLSNEIIDGARQDTWLVTGDEGLMNLSDSIHFIPQIEGSDSRIITFVRHKEQKKSEYWNRCDELFSSVISHRQHYKNITFTESDFSKLLTCIDEVENELIKVFNT